MGCSISLDSCSVGDLAKLCARRAGDTVRAARPAFVAPPPDESAAFAQHDADVAYCEACAPAAAVAAGFPDAVVVPSPLPKRSAGLDVCETCSTLLLARLTAEGVEVTLCELEQEEADGLRPCPLTWLSLAIMLDGAPTAAQVARIRALIATIDSRAIASAHPRRIA